MMSDDLSDSILLNESVGKNEKNKEKKVDSRFVGRPRRRNGPTSCDESVEKARRRTK